MKTEPPHKPHRPTGKVFDIRRPGKTLASPTSRPVIVGHKPAAIRTQIAVSGVGEPEKLAHHKATVEPSPAMEEAAAATIPEAAAAPAVEATTPAPPPAPIAPDPTPEAAAEDEAPERPLDPAVLSQLAVEDPATTELPPEQSASPTPLPHIADVPETEFRHEAPPPLPQASVQLWQVVVLVVSLVLVLAFIFDILLDSGVLTIDSIPHTHFFGL